MIFYAFAYDFIVTGMINIQIVVFRLLPTSAGQCNF